MRRRQGRWAAGTIAVAVLALAGGSVSYTRQAIDLKVVFDGGYIYHTGSGRLVEVKTLQKRGHPLRIKLEAGTWSLGGISEFRLSNAKLEIWPDGTAPTEVKPTLPPHTAQPGCNMAADRKNPNNLYFLPNLAEAAKGMGTAMRRNPAPQRGSNVILTGGGALSIRSVAGCVEYRTANGAPYGDKRSMASGQGGVVYDWRVPSARTITLRITPDGGTPFNVVVTPAGGKIDLRVGDLEMVRPMPKPPYKIAHFDAFDDAFAMIDEKKRVSLFWLSSYEDSPGIDCPSGGDPEPWP